MCGFGDADTEIELQADEESDGPESIKPLTNITTCAGHQSASQLFLQSFFLFTLFQGGTCIKKQNKKKRIHVLRAVW